MRLYCPKVINSPAWNEVSRNVHNLPRLPYMVIPSFVTEQALDQLGRRIGSGRGKYVDPKQAIFCNKTLGSLTRQLLSLCGLICSSNTAQDITRHADSKLESVRGNSTDGSWRTAPQQTAGRLITMHLNLWEPTTPPNSAQPGWSVRLWEDPTLCASGFRPDTSSPFEEFRLPPGTLLILGGLALGTPEDPLTIPHQHIRPPLPDKHATHLVRLRLWDFAVEIPKSISTATAAHRP